MQKLRAYWSCVLVGGLALFALGPAQMNSPMFQRNISPPPRHSAHAPLILRYGPDGKPLRGRRNQSVSTNWSGYAIGTGSTGNYTSASFSWRVQSATYVNYGSSNPYSFNDSSQWVGIGGNVTSDLIQLGSDSYVGSGGTPIYTVWYEMLPADSINLTNCAPASLSSCPVSPGDAMSASLSCTANCTPNNSNMKWTLSMMNSTKGWTWTENFTYQSSLSSAEWIEEAPFYSEIAAIANFGTAPFSDILVNGGSPDLSLSADGIILQDPEGGFATPCEAFNGNRFVVAFGATCISTFDSHDFNNDGHSDIAWRDGSGDIAVWLMSNTTVLSSGGVGTVASTWSLVGQRDFNGDGTADLLWRDSSGNTAMWFLNGSEVSSSAGVGNVPTAWNIAATGDFNGDGMGDILWRDGSGDLAVWLMNGASVLSSAALGNVPSTWTVVGTGDFDGNGTSDLLWRDTSGNTAIWFLSGTQVSSSAAIGNIPTTWSVAATGDLNGDGKSDILWRDNSGNTAIWLMNGASILSSGGLGNIPTTWSVVATGDYNGDGKSDLLWRDTSGNTAIWFMNGATVLSTGSLGNIPTSWTVQSTNAE